MAKRFTDSEKWKKPFIRGLKGPYKVLWLYINDECDHAGIWQVDIEVAQIRTGCHDISIEGALDAYGDAVVVIDDNQWYIPEFVAFQYGTLDENNRVHASVLTIHSACGLVKNKPLKRPLQGRKDKDKDKDKDKEKEEYSEAQKKSFSKFQEFLASEADRVLKMKQPFSIGQYLELAADFPADVIKDICRAMHNYAPLISKNISSNLTFRNWASRRSDSAGANKSDGLFNDMTERERQELFKGLPS